MQQYPVVPLDAEASKLAEILAYIQRLRDEDITDSTNLVNRFMLGRKVGKIPASSADVAATDRIGDFNFALDATYMYFFVDNAGTPEWRRVTMGTF